MAKKAELDFGSFDLDNELDFDNFGDFEDSKPNSASSKREAVTDVVASVGKGFKQSVLKPDKIRNAMKRSLPEGVVGAWDIADQSISKASTLYDEAAKELKPGLSELTKKIDNLVPDESKRLKKVTTKLKDMFSMSSGDYSGSVKEIEDQGVENMLKGVFAAQMEQQDAIRVKEGTEDKLRDRLEEHRHVDQMQLFARMDNNLQRIGEYVVTPNMAFQKKSLELQFRTYFTLGEILKTTKEGDLEAKKTLDGILKNTALPEFVKIKESERFKQIAKDRLWGGIHNRMFGEGTRFERGMGKLQEKGREIIDGFQEAIEGALSITESMESAKEAREEMEELTGKKQTKGMLLGQLAGGYLGDHVISKVGKVVKARVDKNPKLQALDQNLSRWAANPDELINQYNQIDAVKDADIDESIKGKALQLFGGFLDMFRDEKVDITGKTGYGTENLIDSAYTDERTRKAQVDIIPGYLARILREVRVLRTNDETESLTVYDFATGKFKTQKQLSQDIKDSLKLKFSKSSLGAAKDVVSSQFLEGKEHTPEEKEQLSRLLTHISKERGITLDRAGIQNSDTYKGFTDREKELLDKHVFSRIDGEDLDSLKMKTKLAKGRNLIRGSMVDVEKEIKERVEAGQLDELEEAGLIKVSEDRKSWTLNEEQYFDLTDSAKVKSDINVKKNLKKLSPKAMLEKIKKIKVFNWKYKKGEGPQDKNFDGPMAQDVRSNLGEETAPGGKKIDLVSMNGANMSAIQGLSEQVDQMQAKKDYEREQTEHLKNISENTKKLVDLFEKSPNSKDFNFFEDLRSSFNFEKWKSTGGSTTSSGNKTATSDGNKTTTSDEPKVEKETDSDHGVNVKDTTSLIQAAIGILSKGVRGSWNQILKTGKAAKDTVTSTYDKNKDTIKDARKLATDAVFNLVGKGLNFGSDVLFKHVPSVVNNARDVFKKLGQKFKSLVNGAQDLYKDGMDTPIIQAQLMKSGYYIDQATGKPILNIDDLLKIKGHVVNHLGEVIVTAEDVARGLYNSKGERIASTGLTLGRAMLGLGVHLGNKAIGAAKHLLQKGIEGYKSIPGIDKIKATVSNTWEGFKDRTIGGAFGRGHQRTYDVLVQIRDLVSIGKPKKLVESILKRKVGGKSSKGDGEQSKSWMDTLNKNQDGEQKPSFFESIFGGGKENGDSTSTDKSDAPVTNSTGVGGALAKGFQKVKDYFSSPTQQAPNDFVGPMQPQKSKGATLVDKLKNAGKRAMGLPVDGEERPPEMAGPPPELVGPVKPKGPGLLDKLKNAGKRAMRVNLPVSTTVETPPEMVGPQKPTTYQRTRSIFNNKLGSIRKGKSGLLSKGLEAGAGLLDGAKSMISGAASAASSLLPDAQTPQQDTGPKSIGDRFKDMVSSGAKKVRQIVQRKGSKFNDKDGDGSRDGNAAEQLQRLEEEKQQRLERNQASAQAAAEGANTGVKYKSSENVIDTIAKKAGALFDMLKGGAGGIFEKATDFLSMDNLKGMWEKLKNPKALLKGLGKGIGSIGRAALGVGRGTIGALRTVGIGVKAGAAILGAGKVGAAAAGVAKVAGVAKTALTVGGLAFGGVGGTVMSAGALALSGIGAALSSPVVLGALAVAAVGAAGYYGFKYFTRDNLDTWETLRAMQYGLPGTSESKRYNHMVMNLERYFLEGRVGYSDGKAYILDKKVDPKEICDIMSVDPGDKDHVERLTNWLAKRFKPFFLNSVSSVFAVDKKISLTDISKLKEDKKTELLPLIQFMDGPYHETDHPFKDLEEPLTDIGLIKAQVVVIEKDIGKQKIKGDKPNEQNKNLLDQMKKEKKDEDNAKASTESKAALENDTKKDEKGFFGRTWDNLFGKKDEPQPPKDQASSFGMSSANAATLPFSNGSNTGAMQRSEAATDSVGLTTASTAGTPGVSGNSLANSSLPSSGLDTSKVKKVKSSEMIEKMKQIITEAGNKVGIDPRIMQIMAAIESSFNPDAKASTSSATGLFQFISSTWSEMIKRAGSKHGITHQTSPRDPVANSIMGAEFLKENMKKIKNVKPNPNVTDLYIAHFLGPGGAQQFLRAPIDAIGEKIFPKPARANPTIFRGDRGRGQPLTIGQIYQNFENKLRRLAASYGIEFPTTGTNMVTGSPPQPTPEGPTPPVPLDKVATQTPGSGASSVPSSPTASVQTSISDPVPPGSSTPGSTSTASSSTPPTTGVTPTPGTPVPSTPTSSGMMTADMSQTGPFKQNVTKPDFGRTDVQNYDTIPGLYKPQPVVDVVSEVTPTTPKKKYPWLLDERPDDLVVGRSASSKSGEALHGAMDGVSKTMDQQLIVSKEVRDVLKDRVAPALEKMLEVLTKATPSSSSQSSTPTPRQEPIPSKPATQSFLDLKRMA